MIRWFLQVAVMLSDLAIAAACLTVLLFTPFFISIPLVFITYKVWRGQGGTIAWTKKGREDFMRNAKALGI